MTTDQKLSAMIQRAGFMEDAAIECYDMKMFFKYHNIALYLIGRRIANIRSELNKNKV
jgi:hypothetical protein